MPQQGRSRLLFVGASALLLLVIAAVVAIRLSQSSGKPSSVVAPASHPTVTPLPTTSVTTGTPAAASPVPTPRPAVSSSPLPHATARLAATATAGPPAPPGLPPTPQIPPAPPPAPASVLAGPLDGEPTPRQLALRRPLAIMVENYAPDSRPQTGLVPASVVFETLAEDGITRFMAVYQERDAPIVGPVRSARIYYDHWAESIHAIFTHAGGNSDALRELWLLPDLVNIDEVATEQSLYDTGAPYFFRSTDRVAPHNLYAYPALVRAHVAALGKWTEGPPAWTLPHKADLPRARRPATGSIDIAFSSPDYAVHYDFDPRTDTYLRSMGGAPHVDAVSGVQIAPANVVVLFTTIAPDPNSDTPNSIIVQTEGDGQALYFMDGTVRQGTWHKASVAGQLQLVDTTGHHVRFNPGQTWIEVVPQGNSVTWSARAVT